MTVAPLDLTFQATSCALTTEACWAVPALNKSAAAPQNCHQRPPAAAQSWQAATTSRQHGAALLPVWHIDRGASRGSRLCPRPPRPAGGQLVACSAHHIYGASQEAPAPPPPGDAASV